MATISKDTSNSNIHIIRAKDERILQMEQHHIYKVNEYLVYHNTTINKPASNQYVSYERFFKENITLLIVSCQRFSVLSQSIQSFEKYNTYPHIAQKIVLDDCSTDDEIAPMIEKYGPNTRYKYTFLTNKIPQKISNKRLMGSVRGILNQEYLIQHHVMNKTNYYFKSEDDWVFYKHGFIEDSFAIKYGARYWYNESLFNRNIIHPHNILTASLQNLQYPKLHAVTDSPLDTCGGDKNNVVYPQYFTSPILGYKNTKKLNFKSMTPSCQSILVVLTTLDRDRHPKHMVVQIINHNEDAAHPERNELILIQEERINEYLRGGSGYIWPLV